jgi:hypothetical protein
LQTPDKASSAQAAYVRFPGVYQKEFEPWNDSTLVRLLRSSSPEKISGVTTPMGSFRPFALTLGLIAVYGCGGKAEHKNVCPIDGQPPEEEPTLVDRQCGDDTA